MQFGDNCIYKVIVYIYIYVCLWTKKRFQLQWKGVSQADWCHRYTTVKARELPDVNMYYWSYLQQLSMHRIIYTVQ